MKRTKTEINNKTFGEMTAEERASAMRPIAERIRAENERMAEHFRDVVDSANRRFVELIRRLLDSPEMQKAARVAERVENMPIAEVCQMLEYWDGREEREKQADTNKKLEDMDLNVREILAFVKIAATDRQKERVQGAEYGKQGSRERAKDPEVQKRKQAIEKALLKIDRRTPGQSVAAVCKRLCAGGKLLNERGEPMNERTLANIYSKRNVARRKRAQ